MANPLVFRFLTFFCERRSNGFLCLICLSLFFFVVLRFKYYIFFLCIFKNDLRRKPKNVCVFAFFPAHNHCVTIDGLCIYLKSLMWRKHTHTQNTFEHSKLCLPIKINGSICIHILFKFKQRTWSIGIDILYLMTTSARLVRLFIRLVSAP